MAKQGRIGKRKVRAAEPILCARATRGLTILLARRTSTIKLAPPMRAVMDSSAALFMAKRESRKTLVQATGTSQRASTDHINRAGVVSYHSVADNAADSLIST